jgi:uncharacterized iron-regulated membrane protein
MRAATLHRWSVAHSWSSLVCTVFLLAICLTGLPLIFSAEIDQLSDAGPRYAALPESGARADLDGIIAAARRAYPTEIVRSVYWPNHQPAAVVTLAPSDDADGALDHTMTFDARSGAEHAREPQRHSLKFMEVMSHVHEDLFIGLPGELFLGLMALLFVIAIVSGIALYAPFMRHVKFGERRAARGSRVAWLDLHNVMSAVALLWMAILGFTGIVNELATPLFEHWLSHDVGSAFAATPDTAVPARLAPVSAAIAQVEAALPGRKVGSVDFPTHRFGSPIHYIVWTQGSTPLTAHIDEPAFVDAVGGKFAMALSLPWYLLMLDLSRPLHFGDYGGLPLKILWAVFDLITIVVLVSGLKLWVSRRRHLARRRALL